MVEPNRGVSEKENLLEQTKITSELPLAQSDSKRGSIPSNFRDQSLLVVEKKKKFVPAQGQISAEEGVLSIPPEDPPNNCKSKLSQLHPMVVSLGFASRSYLTSLS